MLEFIRAGWAWLALQNALLPFVAVTLLAFGLVFAWRKLSPASWLWLESRLPWALELTKGEELAKNIALSLPSVALGAALSALASGGDLKVAVLGAVAGAFAPLLHHVRKALPFDPYRGALPELPAGSADPADAETRLPKPPRVPLLPILAAGLLLGCAALMESQGKSLVPCDAHDRAAQLDLTANAAKSKAERAKCKGDAECEQAAIERADQYVDERCKLPEGK